MGKVVPWIPPPIDFIFVSVVYRASSFSTVTTLGQNLRKTNLLTESQEQYSTEHGKAYWSEYAGERC